MFGKRHEELKPYIEKVTKGEPDVLWKGKPAYFFAKTSGTTSGTKYIPLSKESVPLSHHQQRTQRIVELCT